MKNPFSRKSRESELWQAVFRVWPDAMEYEETPS